MLHERFEAILAALSTACIERYDGRLLSAAVFGPLARGTMRPDSDIDLLLVVSGLPQGRMPRAGTFDPVGTRLRPVLAAAATDGIHTALSPVH